MKITTIESVLLAHFLYLRDRYTVRQFLEIDGFIPFCCLSDGIKIELKKILFFLEIPEKKQTDYKINQI